MSKGWAGGSTTRWRKVRLVVLARDHYRCTIRVPGTWTTRHGKQQRCMGVADQVHHMLGKAVSGDDMRYLAAACGPCNQRIGEPASAPDPQPRAGTRW